MPHVEWDAPTVIRQESASNLPQVIGLILLISLVMIRVVESVLLIALTVFALRVLSNINSQMEIVSRTLLSAQMDVSFVSMPLNVLLVSPNSN